MNLETTTKTSHTEALDTTTKNTEKYEIAFKVKGQGLMCQLLFNLEPSKVHYHVKLHQDLKVQACKTTENGSEDQIFKVKCQVTKSNASWVHHKTHSYQVT